MRAHRGYQRITGKHDEHFLRRLDRLSATQVDMALTLYRDHELMKLLLGELQVGDSIERVAISIHDDHQGPFIVVTRDGRFVTCLGEGMGAGATPIVTKERFDRVARNIQRVRDVQAEIALHPAREVERILLRLLECGSDISREEFASVVAWQPLLAPEFLRTFLMLSEQVERTYKSLARRQNRFKRKDEPALHRYWTDTWAIAHLSLLLGVDHGQYLRRTLEVPELDAIGYLISWPTVCLNTTSHGLRGAWLAAKVAKPLVAPMKRIYQTPPTELELVDAGIALSAIGHGHSKLKSEIGKLLAQTEHVPEGLYGNLIRCMHRTFAACFDVGVENPELSRVVLNDVAKQLMTRLTALQSPAQRAYAQLVPGSQQFPDDMGVTLLLQGAFPIIDEKFNTLTQLLVWLPHLVRLKADEFYVPRPYLKLFNRTWNVERSIGLIEPRRQIDQLASSAPRATPPAAQRPGRNDPCPCGSQKKYKRCCAHRAST
jgi:hypothetical protein